MGIARHRAAPGRTLAASRRAGVARRGVRAACAGAVGGRCGWRLTGFEVSVGAFALESSADGMVDLLATDTSVMDAGGAAVRGHRLEEDGWVVFDELLGCPTKFGVLPGIR